MTERKLVWQLHLMMARRNIRRVSELRRQLVATGYQISSSQLGRIVSEQPPMLKLDLLLALCCTLRCNVQDILCLSEDLTSTQLSNEPIPTPTAAPRKRHKQIPASTDEDLVGPPATVMPRIR